LTAVTPVLVRSDHGAPDPATLRAALRRWAFNPAHRDDTMPPDIRAALSWIRRASLPITALQDDKTVRQVLDALALKLDSTAASPDYLGRRRRVLYNILKYAVRERRLTENPLDTTEWEPLESSIEESTPVWSRRLSRCVSSSPESATSAHVAAVVSSPSLAACTSPCCAHPKRSHCAPMTATCPNPAGAASN
jgi:hypothetical protein